MISNDHVILKQMFAILGAVWPIDTPVKVNRSLFCPFVLEVKHLIEIVLVLLLESVLSKINHGNYTEIM